MINVTDTECFYLFVVVLSCLLWHHGSSKRCLDVQAVQRNDTFYAFTPAIIWNESSQILCIICYLVFKCCYLCAVNRFYWREVMIMDNLNSIFHKLCTSMSKYFNNLNLFALIFVFLLFAIPQRMLEPWKKNLRWPLLDFMYYPESSEAADPRS